MLLRRALHVQRYRGAALGGIVSGIRLAELPRNPEATAFVKQALLDYRVLFFREQQMTPAEHVALARLWGDVQKHPSFPSADAEGCVTVLEYDADNRCKVEEWHTDMTFFKEPALGSILHGLVVPDDASGDTLWACAQTAFEALPLTFREQLKRLTAEHSYEYGFRHTLAEPGARERLKRAIDANPPVRHPVVRTHPETKRLGLFVNRVFTRRIVDMPEDESAELLSFLYDHMARDEVVVRFQWETGSVAFWDNRCTLHVPMEFFPNHRKMQRVTIEGGGKPF